MFLSKTEEIKSKKAEHALGKIGADLQLLRVKRGERLEDIAAYLGIKSIHLYGLEQGDLSTIPNRYKVRSITSSYANYLGLDSDVIKDRLLPAVQNVEGTKAPSGFWSFAEMDRVAASDPNNQRRARRFRWVVASRRNGQGRSHCTTGDG